MSALTITQSTNGYFNFVPANGKPQGDIKPGAYHINGKLSFVRSNGYPMFQDVDPTDVVIITSAAVTTDNFTTATGVLDKLKELYYGEQAPAV